MDRHRQTPWHARKLTEVYETLHTSGEGLSDAEAAESLEKHGRNALRSKPPKTILQMLKAQIIDPMVLIRIGAATFSAILQEWTEAAVIFVIVIVNAVIGIVQEKKAQSSLEALRNMSAPTAHVLRLRSAGYSVHLVCVCPYRGFERNWSPSWQAQYRDILAASDAVKYVCGGYHRACFRLRNEWMVDHAARVIAVFNGTGGSTRNTIDYAARTGVSVVCLRG